MYILCTIIKKNITNSSPIIGRLKRTRKKNILTKMPGSNQIRTISQIESCGMRHYSKNDAHRLGQQQQHLTHVRRRGKSSSSSSGASGGSGFQAAAALRSHILYKTTANIMSNKIDMSAFLSASLSSRPEWSSSRTKNPKSNAFTTSFNDMMHQDTGIGSIEEREERKRKDELKKIQQHQERAKLYEELVARQEAELHKKQERRRKRRERYNRCVDAAIKIQQNGRIWLARERVKRIMLNIHNSAARNIQMYGKRFIVRMRCKQRKRYAIETKATLKIQFGWKQRLQRIEANEDLLQRRKNRARARRRLLRDMEKERRFTGAMIIQSMVRGWKGRKMIKLMEMEKRRKRRQKMTTNKKKRPEKSKKKGVVGPVIVKG